MDKVNEHKAMKDARRRARIQQLIDSECGGVLAEFARRINANPSYISRMLYPMDKPGKKGISVHTIDTIEEVFQLPRGWLDGAEPPDEYFRTIVRLWPSLPDADRRAVSMMAQALSDRLLATVGAKPPPVLSHALAPYSCSAAEERTGPRERRQRAAPHLGAHERRGGPKERRAVARGSARQRDRNATPQRHQTAHHAH